MSNDLILGLFEFGWIKYTKYRVRWGGMGSLLIFELQKNANIFLKK